jgi:hypothetical protein
LNAAGDEPNIKTALREPRTEIPSHTADSNDIDAKRHFR